MENKNYKEMIKEKGFSIEKMKKDKLTIGDLIKKNKKYNDIIKEIKK